MLMELLEEDVLEKQAELHYCKNRLSKHDVAARRRAVRRAFARLVVAEKALVEGVGDVEDDNAVCANCGQGYDSDTRDTCPNCFYEYRYEK